MYKIVWSKKFKKQFKKISHHNSFKRDIFEQVVNWLIQDQKLEPQYHDHQLKGELQDYRECHLQPDILLIYRKDNDIMVIVFIKIGSHSDLFN